MIDLLIIFLLHIKEYMLKGIAKFVKSHSSFFCILFLLSIALVLIVSWFREGLPYGGGDVGLPTYNPLKVLSILKNVWWEIHAPGFPYPQTLASIPLYLLLSVLQILALPHFAIQAVLFGILLFLSGLGVYFLFLEVVNKNKILAIVSSLFYLLNPYMMIQVWHRFVHTTFFLSAAVPFLTLFFIKFVKTRNRIWIAVFIISSVLASYMYGSLAFMATSWIPILFYVFWSGLDSGLKGLLSRFKDFFLFFIPWVVVHFWWLIPFWTTGPAILTQGSSLYESVSTVKAISGQSTVSNVLRGINPFYLYGEIYAWVNGYDLPVMQFISWIGVFVGLVGVWRNLSKKNVMFWTALFVLSVFVSKGNSLPFGNLFLEIFSHSIFLGAFRNPFEKLGILIPFSLSPLFALGILEIYKVIATLTKKKNIGFFSCILLIFLFLGVYTWPMWMGKVFGDSSNPPYVEVPQEYKDANSWIVSQGKSGRILHLPLSVGDAITYNWKYGYNGIEPSQLVFDTPSVSHGFGLPFLDSTLSSVVNAFKKRETVRDEARKALSNFDIRYIVLHKDVDWKSRGLVDPSSLEKELDGFDFIEKEKEFGQLVIYQVKDNIFLPKIFTADVKNILTGNSKNFEFAPEVFSLQNSSSLFLTPIRGMNLDTGIPSNYSAVPFQEIDIAPVPLAYSENALDELPISHYLPGSPIYPFITLKEKVSLLSRSILDRYKLELEYAGKRLVEATKLKELGERSLYKDTLNTYSSMMDDILSELERQSSGKLVNDNGLPLRPAFERHRFVLEKLGEEDVAHKIKNKLSELGLAPHFELIEKDGLTKFNRRVFRFELYKDQNYEILLRDEKARLLYPGKLSQMAFQIDNRVEVRTGQVKREFLSYGQVRLGSGIHEISMNLSDSINLVPSIDSKDWVVSGNAKNVYDGKDISFDLVSDTKSYVTISSSLKESLPGSTYKIDFDYWVKNGRGPTFQVLQDSDQYLGGRRELGLDRLFERDDYNFYWNSASYFFTTRSNTSNFEVKFVVEPWNTCGSALHGDRFCNNSIVKVFNKESEVLIKNITLKRVLTNELLLGGADLSNTNEVKINQLEITKSETSDYEGKIDIIGPTSFVFLETYHPEWKLSLLKDGETTVISDDKHTVINGYGNLWNINLNPGVYNFKIEFIPQKRFLLGAVVSVVGGISILMFLIFVKRK